jgi:YD repeat-containing protein
MNRYKVSLGITLPTALILPMLASALSSGPAMPEYNDFESVENTDLVNLATGDFTYTLPVMTVPGPGLGFPLVLNYHAGIQPEQEATWVGLGWNLQAGAVTRQVNNFPDDFKGTLINEEIQSQHIYGWKASIGWNGVTVGISKDSEMGLGGMVGYSYGSSNFNVGFTAGTNGVYEGIGASATIGVGRRIGDNGSVGASLTIGSHSEKGNTAGLSAGVSMTHTTGAEKEGIHTSASLGHIGVSLSEKGGLSAGASLGAGYSATSSVTGSVNFNSSSAWVPVWTPWTGYMELNWGMWDAYIDGFQEDRFYGFLYSDKVGMDCNPVHPEKCFESNDLSDQYSNCPSCVSKVRNKKMDFISPGELLPVPESPGLAYSYKLGYTGEDLYSVQTQGMSGSFKPFRTEDGDYYTYLSNKDFTYQRECDYVGDLFGTKCDRDGSVEYGVYFEGGTAEVETKGHMLVAIPERNRHVSSFSQVNSIVWRFNEEAGGALYSDPATRDAGYQIAAGAKRIEPIYIDNGIRGWVLTSADGVRYLYTNPQFNFVEQTTAGSSQDLQEWTRRETPAYAYAWLITAILSPDYVPLGDDIGRSCLSSQNPSLGNVCLPKQGDIGGWVRFSYTDPKTVAWKTPVPESEKSSPSSYRQDGTIEAYSVSQGFKSVGYLSKVETPTHEAAFDIAENSRLDGIPPLLSEVGQSVEYAQGVKNSQGEVCPALNPRVLDRFQYTVRIPVGILPSGTQVTLMARREAVWTKYTCEWGFLHLSATCGDYCRSGIREEKLGTYVLGQGMPSVNGKWEISIPISTRIESVRMVIGKIDPSQSAARLAYLKGITLVNKAFRDMELKKPLAQRSPSRYEVSSVRFAYDYSLAQNTPNSESELGDGGVKGRLTLRGIQIGASKVGPWNPPYTFSYYGNGDYQGPDTRLSGKTISYSKDKKDYWGDYCESCEDGQRRPDGTANAWNLWKVSNPSGSEVEASYDAKRIEYVGGIPTLIEGSKIADYFKVDQSLVKLNVAAFNPQMTDLEYMPKEIMDYFAGKYAMFLGRYDLYLSPVNKFSNLPKFTNPGGEAVKYLLEVPRATGTLDDQYHSGAFKVEYGYILKPKDGVIPNVTPITSTRIETTGGYPDAKLNVGFVAPGDEIPEIGMAFFGLPPFATKIRARAWAIFASKPDVANFGGGIVTSEVKFRETFTGKTNVFSYAYEEGATPALPDPMAGYKLSVNYREATGLKAYIGNPAVLHGKVTVTSHPEDGQDIATEYRFVTSRDLPVRIFPTALTGANANESIQSKVKILDRSGLWGSLWKKIDKDASGNPVRVETKEWALRLDSDHKTATGLPATEDFGLTKDGNGILKEADPKTTVSGSSNDEKSYFSVTQKLWSSRFVPRNCEMMSTYGDIDECLAGQSPWSLGHKGANTTQFELLRFAPLLRRVSYVQDGVETVNRENHFDFLTGIPLAEIGQNTKTNGLTEYSVSLKELAHRQTAYADMTQKNMLTQEFSTTHFLFDSDPDGKDFSDLNGTDLGKATSSQFTLWMNYGTPGQKRYRQQASYALRDLSGFQLPSTTSVLNSHWVFRGKTEKYDDFGHVTEQKDPLGRTSSQIFGMRQSMPIATVDNAARNEIFQQSFEADDYIPESMTGVSGSSASALRSKAGARSLKVANCTETAGGTPVVKPECTDPNQTFVCMNLPGLTLGKTYIASAWYFDDFMGSDPANPQNQSYPDKTTQVTRPGIFIGQDGACAAESHPNGAKHDATTITMPAGNGDWNAAQRASGAKKWKRIWTEFTPSQSCSQGGNLANSILCLYASKGRPGSDVYYDEVRVRPKKSIMSSFTYDHRGNMLSATNANEIVSQFEYDAFGNLTGVRNDDGVLITEQTKKYGQRSVRYSMNQTKEFIEGCEVFNIKANPVGNDEAFDFVSVDAGASYSIKTDAQGKQVSTLCYEPSADFHQIQLLLHGTGELKTFQIGAKTNAQLSLTTVVDHSPSAGFPTAYDEKIYHMKGTNSGSLHFDAFHALRLPTPQELVQKGKISANEILTRYRIGLEITDLPQQYTQTFTSDVPGSNPNTNLARRMHLKFNFFDMPYYQLGSAEDEVFKNVNGIPKLFANSAIADPYPGDCYGSPPGRCYDLVRFGELKCKATPQSAETDCVPPLVYSSKFTLRKTVEWPIEYAAAPIPSSALHNISDADYYWGDFSSLWNKNFNFVFGLFRYFTSEGGTQAYQFYWHPAALSHVPGVTIKVTITPITYPNSQVGP